MDEKKPVPLAWQPKKAGSALVRLGSPAGGAHAPLGETSAGETRAHCYAPAEHMCGADEQQASDQIDMMNLEMLRHEDVFLDGCVE